MTAVELSGEALVIHVLHSSGNAVSLFGANTLNEETKLKRAYKIMALRLHPDKNTHIKAHEAFQVMQQTFEDALTTLHSKNNIILSNNFTSSSTPAPRPMPSSFSNNSSKWPPPPPPPPPPPQQQQQQQQQSFTNSSNTEEKFSSFSHCPKQKEEENYYHHYYNNNEKNKKKELEKNIFVDNGFFEIPLPPDVFFDEFSLPKEEPITNKASSSSSSSVKYQNKSKPKPRPKQTKSLPELDFSSSDSEDNSNDKNTKECNLQFSSLQHRFQEEGEKEKERVNREKLVNERRVEQQQQQQQHKRDASRRSLKQLFEEFNISDDEGDKELNLHLNSNGENNIRCSLSSTQHLNAKEKSKHHFNRSFNMKSSVPRTVVCPFCGTGEFSIQIVVGVICPFCRGLFVPTAVGMMTAERYASKRKKGETPARDELCECRRAKKGMCFLCD